MERTLETQGTTVSRFIEVDPDKLIELGHRMKQSAMDSAIIGESVTARFTDSITLIYHPEREYTKPVHKLGAVGTYGTGFYVENVDEVRLS
jgi:hypothetical protein